MKRPSVCFFARVANPDVLDRVEFYAQDIRLLRELGFDVHVATRPQELRPADLYFVWWWTWAFWPLTLAGILGRPVLVTGVFDEGDNLRRARWQQELIGLSLRRATVNIFCSRLEYETVPRHFRVRRPGYVPLSVDTQLYRPGGARQEPFLLTMAWTGGVNAARKCIPELVQAAAIVHRRHPEVRFVVAGERGDSYPQLARLVRDLGAESYVEFPGVISREVKIDLMQRCQLYLQPSRWEGFGLAILEAMSCGAAVVTSPAGVVPEVAGNAARLVDGTSPSTFAQAIIQLLEDPASRHELGRCARERAERKFPLTGRKRAMSRIIAALVEA